jgi:N-acetylmuramoyl-L-alanine amidase
MMKIEWAGTPNYTKGRAGRKPTAIVNHITAGNYPGCLVWMCNPKAQASAHYLVTKAGQIFQLVRDEDTAWHAGAANKPTWPLYDGTNPNRYTLGIEHEGFDGSLTEAQYQATLWLHRQLVAKHGIPVDKDHIIGHYRIDSVNRPNCPGPKFPWGRLFADLAVTKVTPIQVGGKVLDGVVLADNRTYAPVRAFGEALGFPVVWDPQNGVTVGGVKIDVQVIGGTSYAPVRYLAESLGKTVTWDGTKVVIV